MANPEVIKSDDPQLDSPAWYEFLEMASTKSFRYEGIAGSFTARKRDDGAWNAYRKLFGKLRQEYLGLSRALNQKRLEEVGAKLALPDADYWNNKAKAKQERGYTEKSITFRSATGYTDERITELEAQLQKINQRAEEQDKRIEDAIALLKDALPLPANKGGAIKEKIKQALVLLKRNSV
jgi:hypothetical protein